METFKPDLAYLRIFDLLSCGQYLTSGSTGAGPPNFLNCSVGLHVHSTQAQCPLQGVGAESLFAVVATPDAS